jgi:hypothetical protein
MLASRRTPPATALVCGALLLLACAALALHAPPALAGEPSSVSVRVEGVSETKLLPTVVTTTTAPVVGDGNLEHACPGTSALGALQLATSGGWSGPWDAGFKQYVIFTIEGETHLFEPGAPANYFWSLWIDDRESAEAGACEAELHAGDRVLFVPSCFGPACPSESTTVLELGAPPAANVGEPVTVTVTRYDRNGEGTPASGAVLTGGSEPAKTDAAGRATVTFAHAGEALLATPGGGSDVRAEARVCVHAGNDGTCGTSGSSPGPTPAGGGVASFVQRYSGPYALVAGAASVSEGHTYRRGHAPRILSGTILAHNPVTSVSLELRRELRGRCWAYQGASERFARARCGHGAFFKVASGGAYSYLLPAALGAGRYVLDIRATDDAGNVTRLARATSRIVFHVH